jgi:hypothetical protein
MPKYMALFKANPSSWPSDPKQVLPVIQGVVAGADQLFKMGALKEVGWFTPQEGYAMFEAESKDQVMGMVAGFFPLYTQDIREVVSWEKGKEALLSAARMAASM